MRQYAIIGLGNFGLRMLEGLSAASDEVLVIDRDAELIEKCKDKAKYAYIADVLDEQAVRRILPDALDVAIVDLGSNIEAAILVTNTLREMGVGEIIVKADSERRGGILEIVGATKVVYPDREAAAQIVPLLVLPGLLSYIPLSPSLVMAEVKVRGALVGSTLIEANLRQKFGINVIAIRSESTKEYRYFDAAYKLQADDVLLVAGSEHDVLGFSETEEKAAKAGIMAIFRGLLGGDRKRSKGR
jgi:trk system potassium uptake protein TrkA